MEINTVLRINIESLSSSAKYKCLSLDGEADDDGTGSIVFNSGDDDKWNLSSSLTAAQNIGTCFETASLYLTKTISPSDFRAEIHASDTLCIIPDLISYIKIRKDHPFHPFLKKAILEYQETLKKDNEL